MAEAPVNDGAQSTSELDVRMQFAAVLQEQILSSQAEQERKLAQARTESTNIEVGTVPQTPDYVVKPGERVIASFGRTKVINKDGTTSITTEAAPVHDIDIPKVTNAFTSGTPQFNVENEFRKLRSIQDVTEREDAAQLLFVNLGQQATVIQDRIRTQSAQRSGVNDAQMALDKNIALDAAAVQTGKIRPGDTTMQTENARKAYTNALQAANQLEADLLKKDPEFQRINDYRALVTKEFAQIDKRQDRADRNEERFGVMTDDRLRNAQLALGLAKADTSIVPQVHRSLVKDKALATVLDANKQTLPRFLVDADIQVREYAYKILAGQERAALGLGPKDKLPDYITALEPLVANREALISGVRLSALSAQSKERLKEGTRKTNQALGDKSKTETKTNMLLEVLNSEIEATARQRYQRMDAWTFQDPQLKAVVDSVKLNNKDGKVLMSDGVDAVIKAEMKNPDGSVMSPQQKISALVQSLGITMGNDKASAILPSAENYLASYAADVRNRAMSSYVRDQMSIGRFVGPLSVIPDALIGEGLVRVQDLFKTNTPASPQDELNKPDKIPTGVLGARRG